MKMTEYCPYCMHPAQPGQPCPGCKKDPASYRPSSHHFPPGTLLHDRYLLGRVLGEGGFGITYLGFDISLERRVAVKEYFPTSFVKREASLTLEVTCYTDSSRQYYEKGRDQFLKEARTMARLEDIPQIVRVLDFFPEHNTAYIVMEYLEGETLKDLTKRQGKIPEKALLDMLKPVLRAMAAMHSAGIIHRDISPDNLMLLENGSVKLMDFGCARDIGGGATMTVTLKQGFAPAEQYSGHGQGPWSDLYSFCATIYYCLTGKVPPNALLRDEKQDPLVSPVKLGAALAPAKERAVLKGLAIQPSKRFRSAEQLYGALYGETLDGKPWTEEFGDTEDIDMPTDEENKDDGGDPDVDSDEEGEKEHKDGQKPVGLGMKIGAIAIAAAAVFFAGKAVLPSAGRESRENSRIAITSEETEQQETVLSVDENEALEGAALPIRVEASGADGALDQEGSEASETGADGTEQEETAAAEAAAPAETTAPATTAAPAETAPPARSKDEMEAQAEAAAEEARFSEAADIYKQMKSLGYISNEKLLRCLYEVAHDAEYYWYETDYGNNSSPVIRFAFEQYMEVADQGYLLGVTSVALFYDCGNYVAQDKAKACEWWEKAGNMGDGPSFYFAAQYYADGTGVAQDTQKAIELLNKCLEYGASYVETEARELLERLQNQ